MIGLERGLRGSRRPFLADKRAKFKKTGACRVPTESRQGLVSRRSQGGLAKILIVDDEPLIAMLVEAWIVDMGHEPVGPAHTLAEAQALLAAPFDGAIVDLTLGGDSGRPIAEALAARGAPFVYATGQSEAELGDLPRASGVLLKPFSFEAFEAALRAMLPGI
jgi:DNA-binding NarL/FixJ family response regulator